MTGKIKAIETVYNGYKFRSRLEARWAVFFDSVGVRYEYEPEGYDLHYQGYYLPDFRLRDYKAIIEIKPPPATTPRLSILHHDRAEIYDTVASSKCAELSLMLKGWRVILIFGDPLEQRGVWFKNGILEWDEGRAICFRRNDLNELRLSSESFEGQKTIAPLIEYAPDQYNTMINTWTYRCNRDEAIKARQARF